MSLVHGGMTAAPQHVTSKTAGRTVRLATLCTLTLAAYYLAGARDGAPSSSTQAQHAPVSLAQEQPRIRSARYLAFDTSRESRAADARLQAAARRVCEQMQVGDGIGSLTPYSMCVHEALTEALAVSGAPAARYSRSE